MRVLAAILVLCTTTQTVLAQDPPAPAVRYSQEDCMRSGMACMGLCAQQQGFSYDAARRPVCEASCREQFNACRETGADLVDPYRAVHQAKADAPERPSKAERKALRDKFASQFGIEKWVRDEELGANPFVYRGKVVALPTRFAWAPSEDEAVFFHRRDILVSGLSSEGFKGASFLVLAIRVLGAKAVKFSGGPATISHGEFVGVYHCTHAGCTEFFD